MPGPDYPGLRGLAASVGLLLSVAAQAVDIEVIQSRERLDRPPPAGAVLYAAAVMPRSGWRRDKVEQAIRQARSIFARCRVRVDARIVHRLRAPRRLDRLEEKDQARILAALGAERPIAVFLGETAGGDVAYSYLRSAPVASRGTAWITRRADRRCAGTLLAHELGHILLDTLGHSAVRDNLMSATCTHSNISGSRTGSVLTEAQCRRLRSLADTW